MAIDEDKKLSQLPDRPIQGVDFYDDFARKAHASEVHLGIDIPSELNDLTPQVNSTQTDFENQVPIAESKYNEILEVQRVINDRSIYAINKLQNQGTTNDNYTEQETDDTLISSIGIQQFQNPNFDGNLNGWNNIGFSLVNGNAVATQNGSSIRQDVDINKYYTLEAKIVSGTGTLSLFSSGDAINIPITGAGIFTVEGSVSGAFPVGFISGDTGLEIEYFRAYLADDTQTGTITTLSTGQIYPTADPMIKGQRWVDSNNQVRISTGA